MIRGMDPERIHELAAQMASIADRVRTIEQGLSASLAGTEWVGTDRARFDEEWQQRHVVALRQAADALDDASHVAAENAREQDRASA